MFFHLNSFLFVRLAIVVSKNVGLMIKPYVFVHCEPLETVDRNPLISVLE